MKTYSDVCVGDIIYTEQQTWLVLRTSSIQLWPSFQEGKWMEIKSVKGEVRRIFGSYDRRIIILSNTPVGKMLYGK